MKTIIIFNSAAEQAEIQFYVKKGNYKHLDGVYINSIDANKKLQDELDYLIFNTKEYTCHFPAENFDPNKDIVIVCGTF